MINTEIINFLSEVDTNVFLFFNGIHSPFWDYFMSAFTGKIIWVPMYATILYILLINFHWKVVLCYVAAIALTITFADQMCSSIIRPVVARLRPAQSGKSDCRPGAYRKRLSRRKLRFSFLSCRQLFQPCHVCSILVP